MNHNRPPDDYSRAVFVTAVRSINQVRTAQRLISSIRSFGGSLSGAPIRVYHATPDLPSGQFMSGDNLSLHPLRLPVNMSSYWFAEKVAACAHAEEMVGADFPVLIWISPDTLVLQEPTGFLLEYPHQIALRPVHIRNIGQKSDENLSPYWKAIYTYFGIEPISYTVKSFIGEEFLRAYFNTHAFSVNPAPGLMKTWWKAFSDLAVDPTFQDQLCQDIPPRVFLHQAVFSTLVAGQFPANGIRILPPEYNYPYNLHDRVPDQHRLASLNEVVTVCCEERVLDPDAIHDIEIHEPLTSWFRHWNQSL